MNETARILDSPPEARFRDDDDLQRGQADHDSGISGSGTPDSGTRSDDCFRRFDARRCVVCCNPLSVHEQATGETCSHAACRHQFLRAEVQEQFERKLAIRKTALERRESIVRSQGIDDPERLGVGILPSNQRRLTNLPEKRVRKFRDRLMGIISEAAAIRFGGGSRRAEVDESLPSTVPLASNQLAVLGNACATCRGECCSQGGDHAFIQVATILGHMDRHPGQRPWQILEDYLSHLGSKTYDQACVFQAASGCNLPREMRAYLCNAYHCKGLSEVLHQLPESPESTTFVVAMDGEHVVRAALIDADRCRLYDVAGQRIDCASGNQPHGDPKPLRPPESGRPSQLAIRMSRFGASHGYCRFNRG